MKNKVLFFSLLSSITLCSLQVSATSTVKTTNNQATFDIITDPNGTMLIEADNLSFGEHTIVPSDINAKTIEDSSIKITEYSGEKPGWNLKVQLDKFTDNTNNQTIDGVRLFYPTVTPETTTTVSTGDEPVTMNSQDSFLDSLKGTIVNDNNTQVKIAEAAVGKGYGIWTLPYDQENRIQLNIPAGQRVGAYTATLTYTIEEGP